MDKITNNAGVGRAFLWNHVALEDPISFFQYQWEQHLVGAQSGCGTSLNLVSKSGVAVAVHQAVLLPLSSHLNLLVESSDSCGCPNDVAALLLPDWEHKTILACIQLLYSGSVIVTSEEMDELLGLIHNLRLEIPAARLSMELVREATDNDPPADKDLDGEASAAPETKPTRDDRLLEMMKDINSQIVDLSNDLKQKQVEGDFDISGDESWRDELIFQESDNCNNNSNETSSGSHEFATDSGSHEFPAHSQNILETVDEFTAHAQNIPETGLELSEDVANEVIVVKEETLSDEDNNKTADVANELTIVKEENQSSDEGNHETADCDESNLKTINSCHLCETELGFVKANVYYHYATVHFADQLFTDFSQQVDGKTCLFCGEIMPKNVRRYWFLVHMGVKHKGVKRYLPPHQHIGITKKGHVDNLMVDKNCNDSLEQGDQLNNKESWKEIAVCPVCSADLSSLNFRKRNLHFYEHFKSHINVWLDGMQEIFTHDPKMCPQCKVKFLAKKSLGQHMGSVHNLYQMFIGRFRDGQLTKIGGKINVKEQNCSAPVCQIKSKDDTKSKSEAKIVKHPKRRKRCETSSNVTSEFGVENNNEDGRLVKLNLC